MYNPEFPQRTKHFKLKWHWIREQVIEGNIVVKIVRTNEQLANIFPKALAGPKFVSMRRRIGLGQLEDQPSMRFRKSIEVKSHTCPQRVTV